MKEITPGQLIAINRLAETVAKTREARLYVVSGLIGRDITSTKELTRKDWVYIRGEAYPFWKSDDWMVGDNFKIRLAGLYQQFQEDVLGQMRMF